MTTNTNSFVFFPGAGSFGSEFQALLLRYRPNVHLLRYAWRNEKSGLIATESFDEGADKCAKQIREKSNGKLILFGHSFGAYLAFTTATILERTGYEIAGLFTVAANAPSYSGVSSVPQSEEEIENYWKRVEPGIFERFPDPEWKDLLIETTRKDFSLLSTFKSKNFGLLQCPLYVAAGQKDPLVCGESLEDWRSFSIGKFGSRSFPGGHSDLLENRYFIEWVNTTAIRD